MSDATPRTDQPAGHQAGVCPHCGYCPTCGRANALPVLPPPYRPWPWGYPLATPWWGVVPPAGHTWPVVWNGTTAPTDSGGTTTYKDPSGYTISSAGALTLTTR